MDPLKGFDRGHCARSTEGPRLTEVVGVAVGTRGTWASRLPHSGGLVAWHLSLGPLGTSGPTGLPSYKRFLVLALCNLHRAFFIFVAMESGIEGSLIHSLRRATGKTFCRHAPALGRPHEEQSCKRRLAIGGLLAQVAPRLSQGAECFAFPLLRPHTRRCGLELGAALPQTGCTSQRVWGVRGLVIGPWLRGSLPRGEAPPIKSPRRRSWPAIGDGVWRRAGRAVS